MIEIRYNSIKEYTDAFIRNYDKILPVEYEPPSQINISVLDRINDVVPKQFIAGAIKIGTTYFTMFTDHATAIHVLNNPQTHVNEHNVLHSTDGPAVKWDDLHAHMIHGVAFQDVAVWQKIADRNMSVEDMLALQNMEQRRVALTHFGPEKMFEYLKPNLISSSKRGNKLYTAKMTIPRNNGINVETTIAFLIYNDPHTSRQFMSFVDPDNTDADDAMVTKFPGLTRDDYDVLEVEA